MKVWFCLGLLACGVEPAVPSQKGWVPDLPGYHLERSFLAPGLLGGFDGAFPAGAEVRVDTAAGPILGQADAWGRLALALPSTENVAVQIDKLRILYELPKHSPVHPLLSGAGAAPNDLVFEGDRALLVRSGDNALGVVDATGLAGGVRLPDGANPWFVAPLGDGRAAVTAFGHDRIYLVDVDQSLVEQYLELQPVLLPEPFTLSRPYDLDGDGSLESSLTQVAPKGPQAVVVSQNRLWAAYSGFVTERRDGLPPVYVPGVVAAWTVDHWSQPPKVWVTPALNPQELRPLENGQVLLTMTGALDLVAVAAVTPGLVSILDFEAGFTENVAVEDFAPGTAVLFEDHLWVGSLVRGQLLQVSLRNQERRLIQLSPDPVDSVFRLVELGGGLLAVPVFNSDRLHFVDMRTGALNPAPFFEALAVGPGRPLFDGLQIVARRPGRPGVDFVGPDLLALFGPASRIVPLELRQWLGPQ